MGTGTKREIWIEEQGDKLGGQEAVTVIVSDGAVSTEYRDVLISEKSGTPEVGSTAVHVHDGFAWVWIGDADTGNSDDEWTNNIADILEAEYERAVQGHGGSR